MKKGLEEERLCEKGERPLGNFFYGTHFETHFLIAHFRSLKTKKNKKIILRT